jgi:hypothetical protein
LFPSTKQSKRSSIVVSSSLVWFDEFETVGVGVVGVCFVGVPFVVGAFNYKKKKCQKKKVKKSKKKTFAEGVDFFLSFRKPIVKNDPDLALAPSLGSLFQN